MNDSKDIQTSSKDITEKSTKMIRVRYYSTILLFFIAPISIINGLISEHQLSWMLGTALLVTSILVYPSNKKQMDAISKNDDDTLSFLKMRLAKGEITKEEFDELRKKIE